MIDAPVTPLPFCAETPLPLPAPLPSTTPLPLPLGAGGWCGRGVPWVGLVRVRARKGLASRAWAWLGLTCVLRWVAVDAVAEESEREPPCNGDPVAAFSQKASRFSAPFFAGGGSRPQSMLLHTVEYSRSHSLMHAVVPKRDVLVLLPL